MTITSVTPLLDKLPDVDARRDGRYAAQRMLWRESSLPRLRHCGRSMSKHTGDGHTVKVKHSDGVTGFSGLQTCGSVWACAVCAQKIASVRAADIGAAADAWHMRGSRIVFLTLTMRHNKGQRLADLWDNLAAGWKKVASGRPWAADCEAFGIPMTRVIKTGKRAGQTVIEPRIPYIRAVESTHGANGWHLHIHALLFVSGKFTDADVAKLRDGIYSRWSDALTSRGMHAPSRAHGIDAKLVRRGSTELLGGYFAKSVYTGRAPVAKGSASRATGWEVAGGSGKTARGVNRTPFQILADVEALGDADDLAIWWEWESASKGRRQITWSVGLREFLGLNAELTDEEIAEEELGGSVVMEFDAEEWAVLQWHKDRICSLIDAGVRSKPDLIHAVMTRQKNPRPAVALN